jgi:hypothetical protein
LHTLGGATRLNEVGPAAGENAYNLVVADFHTYVVGKSRLLVHDNSAPASVLGSVPGLDDGIEGAMLELADPSVTEIGEVRAD